MSEITIPTFTRHVTQTQVSLKLILHQTTVATLLCMSLTEILWNLKTALQGQTFCSQIRKWLVLYFISFLTSISFLTIVLPFWHCIHSVEPVTQLPCFNSKYSRTVSCKSVFNWSTIILSLPVWRRPLLEPHFLRQENTGESN